MLFTLQHSSAPSPLPRTTQLIMSAISRFNSLAPPSSHPKTPNLTDNEIPCVNSVRHLIAHCLPYEDPTSDGSGGGGGGGGVKDQMELLVSNPSGELELLFRGLRGLAEQAGVPGINAVEGKRGKKKISKDDANQANIQGINTDANQTNFQGVILNNFMNNLNLNNTEGNQNVNQMDDDVYSEA